MLLPPNLISFNLLILTVAQIKNTKYGCYAYMQINLSV